MGLLDGLLMAMFRRPLSKATGALPAQDAQDAIREARKAVEALKEQTEKPPDKKS